MLVRGREHIMTADDIPDRTVPGVEPYDGPAGGWGALKAVAQAVRDQMGASTDTRALLKLNQPTGFDCPGCAWPDPQKDRKHRVSGKRVQDLVDIGWARILTTKNKNTI